MKQSFLDNLIKENEFPIIFIGSGITRRYFKDAPTWDKLLHILWNETNPTDNYYSAFHDLSKKTEDSFYIYTSLASKIESRYDDAFYDGKIKLPDLTLERAHKQGISPFRTRIADIFSKLQPKDEVNEINLLKKMLVKARFIVTTNYDEFLENELNGNVNIKVGNKGLFSTGAEFGELYKIHGSISDPNSIVITEDDYKKLKRTSAIINAKILSRLTVSPILFLGYSLTDKNVKSLLKDLSDNMPFSIREAAERIGVVEYNEGHQDIVETTMETDGVHYTNISTDNYSEVYKKIAKIDQGVSPIEISKYQDMIKQIIVTRGKSGELKHVLTSVGDLNNLPEKLKRQDIVVAMGDSKYIYKIPNYVDYVKDYYLHPGNMPEEIALPFILKSPPHSTLPISKYIHSKMKLASKEKDKINARLKRFNSLEELKNGISISRSNNIQLEKEFKDTDKAIDFLKGKNNAEKLKRVAFLIKKIDKIKRNELEELVMSLLREEDDSFLLKTNTRKFFMAYSLLTEKIFKQLP
ncbi:SIR2 family protein [Lactobacillus sp. ESL0259]|uniref:SIR2 family protein n=1 Tax=Lactobacillus sp. ESL0259 TaxID=2069346 RepID=UPI001314ACFB|nr:SIR2 family protein [Lactobacillus sp. ESL0259]